ncbi:hypothetical protein GCM10008967_27480 [Bacillus carboniphilus]|uniref:Uncharacterized protein n=1 Tax=Bacillus carboniphilus TaxID=86663 RepID=A0ABN0WEY5_9BACI
MSAVANAVVNVTPNAIANAVVKRRNTVKESASTIVNITAVTSDR